MIDVVVVTLRRSEMSNFKGNQLALRFTRKHVRDRCEQKSSNFGMKTFNFLVFKWAKNFLRVYWSQISVYFDCRFCCTRVYKPESARLSKAFKSIKYDQILFWKIPVDIRSKLYENGALCVHHRTLDRHWSCQRRSERLENCSIRVIRKIASSFARKAHRIKTFISRSFSVSIGIDRKTKQTKHVYDYCTNSCVSKTVEIEYFVSRFCSLNN